jgi:serine phosphatase RsbU (regulator of sigma subunit)
MQCMDLWGGNHRTDRDFETAGLDINVYSRPFGESQQGGDVYFLSSCAAGRITRLLLADLSGHGHEVAELGGRLRELMRRNVNIVSQTRMAKQLNRQFADLSGRGGFATALLITFFAPTRSLTVCNAGHPAPFLFDSSRQRWSAIETQPARARGILNTPLGVVEGAEYPEVKFRLKTGDALLCFSDGLTESFTANGSQLGQTGLLRIVDRLESADSPTHVRDLLSKLQALHADNLTQDDISVVQFRATASRSSLRNSLLAPFRLLRPATDHTTLGTVEPSGAVF